MVSQILTVSHYEGMQVADGILLRPTIKVDENFIMKDGKTA